MFRSESLTAHVMADVYVDGSDQQIGDDDWIADIGARGWIALTKDSNIARHHKQALTSSGLRVFAIDSANLTGEEMADRLPSAPTSHSQTGTPMYASSTRTISSFDGDPAQTDPQDPFREKRLNPPADEPRRQAMRTIALIGCARANLHSRSELYGDDRTQIWIMVRKTCLYWPNEYEHTHF